MKWLLGIALGVLLTFFMRDLAKPGLPMLHDSNPHIARMIAFHTALEDGQFPPMWAKELLGGIGSPVMMLNYQLPYFITEGLVRTGLTYFDSYKFILALSFILSGLLMYAALRSKYAIAAAWAGSLIYTLAPYRFVDIYVRGALGESLTFIFPPLLIWGYFRSSTQLLILGWAGLFLTHPVASALFSAFFLGYCIVTKNKFNWLAYLVAIMLSMFNILPTLALTKFTYYSPTLSNTLLMFPTLGQLIKSPWGYGVSLPGPSDGMSFEVGITAWVVLVTGSIWSIVKKDKMMAYFSSTAWLTILLILPISLPIYEIFLGRIIDFPWRLLMCIVFATAWMGAVLIQQLIFFLSSRVKSRDPSTAVGMTTVVVTILLVIQSLPMAHTGKYWDKSLTWFARETGDSYGEYAPLTRETRDSAPFGKRAEFISGGGSIEIQIEKSNLQRYLIKSDDRGEIRINTAYFPGWIIPSNCYVTKRTLSHIDDSGLIGCMVPTGESILEIRFESPTVQRVGNLITLAGIGAYLWILYRSFFPRLTKKTQ